MGSPQPREGTSPADTWLRISGLQNRDDRFLWFAASPVVLWYGRPSTLTCPADSSTVGRAYCQVHPGGRGHLGGCLALRSLGGMTGPLRGTCESSCGPGAREGRPAGWAATVPGAPARGVEGPRAAWFTLQRCGPDSHLQHHQKVRSPHRKPGGLLHMGLVETSWLLGAPRRHQPPYQGPQALPGPASLPASTCTLAMLSIGHSPTLGWAFLNPGWAELLPQGCWGPRTCPSHIHPIS